MDITHSEHRQPIKLIQVKEEEKSCLPRNWNGHRQKWAGRGGKLRMRMMHPQQIPRDLSTLTSVV